MNFFLPGRHFGTGAAIDDVDFIGSQPHGRAGHIDGHIAAADDGDFLADIGLAGEVDLPQEFNTLAHPDRFLAGDTQFDAFMGAKSQVNRFVTVTQQIIHGQIRAQRRSGLDLDTQIGDYLDFLVKYFPGQAVRRDPDSQHTTGLGQGFVNGGHDALAHQVIGAGKTCRTGSYNGDFLQARSRDFDLDFPGIIFIGSQSL